MSSGSREKLLDSLSKDELAKVVQDLRKEWHGREAEIPWGRTRMERSTVTVTLNVFKKVRPDGLRMSVNFLLSKMPDGDLAGVVQRVRLKERHETET